MTETPPERMDWWFTAGSVACLIAGFLFILYPGVILGIQSFFYGDFGSFTYPVAWYTHASFWRGEIPLWNPLINSGVPFLAQWNTTVCYPLSLLYILLPLPWSLNLFGFVHLVIAGVGMHQLAHRWTGNPLAASVAGVTFALNGLMLGCIMWTSNLAALTWQPWVILLVAGAWRSGGNRRLVLAAFAGAMQMLAGAPEIIIFTWLMLAVLWVVEVGRKEIAFWPTSVRLALIVALVAGLAACQLFPFLDLLKQSERSAGYALADKWPMPLWGWANYLVPAFHTRPAGFGTYLQEGQIWTPSYYLGAIVLVLALLALGRKRPFRLWWLAGAAMLGLLLALGNAGLVYAAIKRVLPQIGFARFPIKFVALPTFALPLLAAFGFNQFQCLAAGDSRRAIRALLWSGGLILGLVGLIISLAHALPSAQSDWTTTWTDGVSRALFLSAIIAAMIVLVRAASPSLRALASVAIVVLAGLDLTLAGRHQNPVVTSKAFSPLELNMTSRPKFGESRAFAGPQTIDLFNRSVLPDPLRYQVGLRGTLCGNLNLPEDIPKVGGFCSLHPRWEMDMLAVVYNRTDALPAGLADFLGIAQVASATNVFDWEPRHTFLPLVTAGQLPVFEDDVQVVERMAAGEFDPRGKVYLPWDAHGVITVTNASVVKIIPRHYGAQQIAFSTEAVAPAMAVVAQTYYHNWQASVDGVPVHLWSANHAYQALEIPVGRHEVILDYDDHAFKTGAVISGLALLGCLALWLVPGRSRAN